jgi:predicted porin
MTSLKKLVAVLAVSLPLAALAQQAAAPAADKPPVAQIYGTLNMNIQSTWADGASDIQVGPPPATLPAGYFAKGSRNDIQARWAVSADSSNIGVKGTAAVAAGLGVVYQCETSAKLTGYTTNVTSASLSKALGFLCDRNSRLGLSHPVYGTLFLGNWDTPFKAAYYGTKADDPFGSTDVFGANNMLGSPGFNVVSGSAPIGDRNGPFDSSSGRSASFDQRAQNSIAYWTPQIMGFSARFQLSVNEFSTKKYTDQEAGATAVPVLSPSLYSGAVNYDQGPLSVVVAYEQHRDFQGMRVMFGGAPAGIPQSAGGAVALNGLNTATTDQAWRVAAGYEIPTPVGPLTVAGVWEKLIYNTRNSTKSNPAAAVPVIALSDYQRNAYGLSAKYRTGDHELRFRYNWADKGSCKAVETAAGSGVDCTADGTSARQIAVGYAYYLAASTQVYAFWDKITNSSAATYTLGAGGAVSGAPAVVGGTPYGADPQAVGVGMKYAF